MLGQMAEYRQTVVATPTLDVHGVRHAAINALSAGFCVGANNRVHNLCLCIVVVAAVGVTKVLFRFFAFVKTTAAVYELRREDAAPANQVFFHAVAQSIKGCGGIGELGVAPSSGTSTAYRTVALGGMA